MTATCWYSGRSELQQVAIIAFGEMNNVTPARRYCLSLIILYIDNITNGYV
jgi:hypothetical protein